RRAALERSLVAELSILREDRGLPPLEWDPRLALTLREYLADMLERGWKGGPPMATPAGKATLRAKQRHRHPAPEVFDNFSPQAREEFSVEKVADALITAELMASFRDAANGLAAAAIVEGEAGVFSCIAVVKADDGARAGQAQLSGQAAATWLAVLGSRGEARAEAMKLHLPTGSAAAVPWLLHLLRTDRDKALRVEVIRALGRAGTTTAIAPLIEQVAKGKDDAKAAAAEALAALTGQAHGDSAKAWAGWWEGAKANVTLAPLPVGQPPEPPQPVPGPAALSGFKKAVKSKDPALRVIACRGIGHAKPERAASTVAKLLGDPDDEVRRAAAAALGALGETAGLSKLQKSWKSVTTSPRLARAAVAAAGGIRDTKAVDFLVGLLPTLKRSHGDGVSRVGFATLRTLTGHDAGEDAGAWKSWWKGAKREFTFPEAAQGK
ncbi:MAG: HEAT repeat domain-containing protein, partial [Planctomycetota bacterium]